MRSEQLTKSGSNTGISPKTQRYQPLFKKHRNIRLPFRLFFCLHTSVFCVSLAEYGGFRSISESPRVGMEKGNHKITGSKKKTSNRRRSESPCAQPKTAIRPDRANAIAQTKPAGQTAAGRLHLFTSGAERRSNGRPARSARRPHANRAGRVR